MSSPSPLSGHKDKVRIRPSASDFAPKFDADGLIPAMAIDAATREPLMFAYMNAQSLKLTLECGEAVYWSRSRSEIWHKGKTSGHTQKIVEIRTDCDQDVLILLVDQPLSPSLRSDPIALSEASRSKQIPGDQTRGTISFLGLQMKIINVLLMLTCCSVIIAVAVFLNFSANRNLNHSEILIDLPHSPKTAQVSIGVPYTFDFKKDPTAAGWTVDGADKLLSPKIKCAPAEHQFYRLTFESQAKSKSNYSVHFQNALGEEIESDDYASFYPSDNWTPNEVYFRGREGGLTFQLSFHVKDAIKVRNVTVETANISDVAKWSDKIFSSLPPLNSAPQKEIGKRIPMSLTKLRNHQRLRVVMLGDSIVNDSYNSHWDALVSRVFKGADLEVIASVRGSTGCQFYQKEENFKRYITDRKPELLMIGGISHGSDLAALREVISKTRVALPDCEILIMSGPVGKDFRPHDINAPEALIPACSPIVDSFAAEQEKLANELGIEYWDLATAWSHYLASSGKPFEWFHRDYIHANNRGKQVIARILEANFMECAR